MGSLFYLDVDDEITSAASRIRTSEDPRVGLVVPSGSRIATSRINFRLLAREALERNRALSIISADPAARALAASAGLPVFATVGEFEADQGGARVAGTAAATAAAVAPGGGSTTRSAPDPAGAAAMGAAGGAVGARSGAPDPRIGARSSGTSAPAVRAASKPSRGSARYAATAVALVVMALVFGLIGVFLLPSATITVTPKLEAVGPLQLSIRADPTVTAPDPVAGVVPAIQLSKDFTSFATFSATGTKTTTTPAIGAVRFTNYDTGGPAFIAAGSKVSTSNGVVFATTQDLNVKSAQIFPGPPSSASVNITAVVGGPAGNVGAGTIRQVPSSQNSNLLRVTNPSAATGGTSKTTTQIQKKDTDAAVASLTKGLKQQFAAWLLAPDALPLGSTPYPKTGILSTAAADTDPATLVGIVETSFQLTLSATGTETVVDQSTVTTLALGRIKTSVPSQFSLVTGSERVVVGTPRVDAEAVVFPVRATASQVRHIDPDTLRGLVKGKSVDEARVILADYGTVDIRTWPGFVGTIPGLEWRLTLTIDTGSASGSAGPLPSSSATPSPPGPS